MILKVAEFLEGDDLLRMRLSQAILATLSDPKHDFLTRSHVWSSALTVAFDRRGRSTRRKV